MPTVTSTPYAWNELLLDRFVGAANAVLTAHTPDFGGPWTAGAGYVCKLDGAGGVWSDGTDAADATPQAITPAAAHPDAFAQCVLHLIDGAGGEVLGGVVARWVDASNCYALQWRNDSSVVQLLKLVAGVQTSLHDEPLELADGADLGLQLFCVGNRITAVVNGAIVATVTDAGVAGAGATGLITNADYASGLSHGIHVHQFLAGAAPA